MLLSMCALTLLIFCANVNTGKEMQRVLFVGNSVIYTNNLPAVFGRIADMQPNAPAYEIDMFMRGGATLTELGQDYRMLELLKSDRYDVVVFQKRGGDDLCVLVPEDQESLSCQALINSHVHLASLARKHGARVLYLGTYQLAPVVSNAIVRAERALAVQMVAQYVEVSEHLRVLRETEPEFPWLYKDGGHPGVATTALMGVLIYKALNGNDLIPFDLCIDAERYTPKWKHDGVVRNVDIFSEVEPNRCMLSQSQMSVIAQDAVESQSPLEQ
ncbi:MAG: SGNH/GDSL hydrolase family protein [Gammaproteobacteria bacterium]|nr:SGNH/GDSL hydrolase family protein [Gammaproteobacteria bacterium]